MGERRMTDTHLRELYARATTARTTSGYEGHPSPEELLALVQREGPEEQRLEVLDHVMACDDCRSDFELLRAVEDAGATAPTATEAPALPDVIPLRRPGRRWTRFVPMALAAALLLAVGLSVGVPRFGGDATSDVMRGEADAVTLLSPSTEAAAGSPILFAWRPIAGARRYELEVVDGGGTAVYSTATSDTAVLLRDVSALAAGVEYQWWVRAVTDTGAQPRSTLRPLRLQAR
jgi:hypothetical protein